MKFVLVSDLHLDVAFAWMTPDAARRRRLALRDVLMRVTALVTEVNADALVVGGDELSLGLAPKLVDEIVARLPEVTGAGTAVVLVEQDIGTAFSVSERAYVLETGRIGMHGSSTQLLADPRIQEAYLGVAEV
jgi:ABC-type branched-subunit amino acid transport system ATPase component